MKKRSKFLALAMATAMALSLAACSPAASDPTDQPDPTTTPEQTGGESYVVGICQLAPHVALDAATQGFLQGGQRRRRLAHLLHHRQRFCL